MITDNGELAQTFNEYFVNIVPSLGIIFFRENNDNVNNDNIDNIIIKSEGQPSIVAGKEQMKKYNKTFTFQNVSKNKFASIIKKLDSKKPSKSDDIFTKVIKELGTFFAEFLSKHFNSCLETDSFLEGVSVLKLFLFVRKMMKRVKVTIDLRVIYPTFQKYMKGAFKNKLMNISVTYYQNISVVSG